VLLGDVVFLICCYSSSSLSQLQAGLSLESISDPVGSMFRLVLGTFQFRILVGIPNMATEVFGDFLQSVKATATKITYLKLGQDHFFPQSSFVIIH
jgi:hypothetical protein